MKKNDIITIILEAFFIPYLEKKNFLNKVIKSEKSFQMFLLTPKSVYLCLKSKKEISHIYNMYSQSLINGLYQILDGKNK